MLIARENDRPFNENKALCSACQGRCCKSLPGCFLPEDFMEGGKVDWQAIENGLQKGKFSIDYWEEREGPSLYFLRPATKSHMERNTHPTRWVDASWGGECVFLTETGCSLSPQARPAGCLDLVPKVRQHTIPATRRTGSRKVVDYDCQPATERADKLNAGKAWCGENSPYKTKMLELVNRGE